MIEVKYIKWKLWFKKINKNEFKKYFDKFKKN